MRSSVLPLYLILLFSFLDSPSLFGKPPNNETIFPLTVPFGQSEIQMVGDVGTWPSQAWADTPGIVLLADTNKNGRYTVTVETNVVPGPHLIRFFNAEGASKNHFLVISSERLGTDTEPNDDHRKPQVLSDLPLWINGKLDKRGDVDSFAIALEAGQTLVARMEAYLFAAPFDGAFKIVDSRGITLAFNHDEGVTLDPLLAWTAPEKGTYIVQVFGFPYPAVSDINLGGSASCVYRVHFSKGPYARYTIPLGVPKNSKSQLQLVGWNKNLPASMEVDAGTLLARANDWTLRSPLFENELPIRLGEGAEWKETEVTTPLNVPSSVTGILATPGEVDRYAFVAKKGERLQFETFSASLGFPTDLWLRLENAEQKEITRVDDAALPDPALEWVPPEDGKYHVAVGNLIKRGGADFVYRVSVKPMPPSLKATVPESSWILEAGKTNEIKVAVQRIAGFSSKLKISAKGLPATVQWEAAEVAENAAEGTIKLIAAAEATAHSGSFQILLTDASNQEMAARHVMTVVGENNGVPNGYKKLAIPTVEHFWLTVLPAKK